MPTGTGAALQALGARVRTCREARGLTQEALAFRARVDRTYISNVERGRQNPTYLQLRKIARVLGVQPAALLPEEDV